MRLRPPVPDDAPAVFTVLAPRDVADIGMADVSLEDVRAEWRASDLDPAAAVTLRPVDVHRDAVALHALDDAAFSDRADYTPVSLAAFSEEHLNGHDVDAGLSRVVELDGRIAGFALTRRWPAEGIGHIALLGVDAEHRRRGLGTLLLQSVFVACAAAGLREAQLSVASDNPLALALYERVGMRPRFQHDIYERPVG